MFPPEIKISELNQMNRNTIMDQLGIEFTEIGEDFIKAKMPVDHRTHQPFGILHGGASVVLAETLGSVASHATIDNSKQFCVGLEVNANHIKAMREGWVFGTVKGLHLGKKTHVWEIRITDEKDQLVSISRLTMAVIDRNKMKNQELSLNFLQGLESEFSGLCHLFEKAVECHLPVALWKLPHQEEKHLIIDLSGESSLVKIDLEELGEGFAISPFINPDGTESRLIRSDLHYRTKESSININPMLSADQTERIRDIFNNKPSGKALALIKDKLDEPFPFNSDKENYQDIIQAALNAIESGEFQKVVPSRIKTIDFSEDQNLVQIFLDACNNYPNAFVSLVSSTHTGTWIGVSPETLISVDREKTFRTASVAGTQIYHQDIPLAQVPWTQKEIEEQAFVSRYIINCFKKIRLREFEEIGPRTVKAANLIHLRTDYVVDMKALNFPQLGTVMLDLLHPTSAVCGMPKEPALAFLQSHEKFERRFYSGYLGPVNIDQESHLFVNLRCMQIFSDKAILYSGAGTTSDSVPEKEWEETENKMQTLLNLIEN